MMLENIAQLKKLDAAIYATMVNQVVELKEELETIWQEPYPEYASAGLKVATLLNHTGEQQNFDYRDCRSPQITPLLHKLPAIKEFLTSGNLEVMGARLLRLDPGTFLHEHRDFIYLEEVPRYRLHLPLITNDQAFIVSPDVNVHFKQGYLWKLNPKQTIHSACNFGSQPRLHLMIDCYVNGYLADLIKGQFLDNDCQFVKPAFTESIKADLIQQALSALEENQIKEAEEIILASFCLFNLYSYKPGLTTYDLLSALYDQAASLYPQKAAQYASKMQAWLDRLVETYPERKEKTAIAV
ncbi:MAG: aspartyl/asparaginyl beta-hydroxylase domain-containing protein [Candidatus Obscuribacter sp.]|nr:aspartyl/asparaginyl beta-hydroxylase domain-containing protein [Candidatus Obscuribacter sp.]